MAIDGETLAPHLPRIEPPEGWQLRTPEGVLRLEKPEGDEGRLARLDAVVQYLMKRDGLPCSAVVARVCDALDERGDALPLYLLQPTGFSVALPGNAPFGGMGLHQHDIRPATCGRRGAISAMRKHWAQQPQCSVYEAINLDCIAVTLRHACELWGYGLADIPALALPDPAQLEPVEGWRITGKHGHMAFSVGKAGRLVGLADLVQWLIDTQDVPCSIAVEDVCQKLRAPDAASWLYMVEPGKLARQLTSKDDFSYLPFFVLGAEREVNPKDCGLTGVLLYMREYWADSSSPIECDYMGAHTLEPLAIRMDVAHALWGWGSVGTTVAVVPTSAPAPGAAVADPLGGLDAELRAAFEAVCKRRAPFKDVKNGAREPWLDDDVETLRRVRDALGRSWAKTIAPLFDVTESALRKLVNREAKEPEVPAPTANNPFGQVRPKAA